MRIQLTKCVFFVWVCLLAGITAPPADAQTRTEFIPFQDQAPDVVLLRDDRVLTGHVLELNEFLVIATPKPIRVERSLVSLILVNSQHFPATLSPLLLTEDVVLLKEGGVFTGRVVINGEDVLVGSMRLQQSQVRLIKLKEKAVRKEPPPDDTGKSKKVRPRGFWVGQIRIAVLQQFERDPELPWLKEHIPQVVRYNGLYSLVLREGYGEDDPQSELVTIPYPDGTKYLRTATLVVEKWGFNVRVDDCDSFLVDTSGERVTWSRTKRPDMYWRENLTRSEINDDPYPEAFGLLFYEYNGKERRPLLEYQLNIPPLTRNIKADKTSPIQDWTETYVDGRRTVFKDQLFHFMPWFRPSHIHVDPEQMRRLGDPNSHTLTGAPNARGTAERDATMIRGKQSTHLRNNFLKHGGKMVIDHAVLSWDFRWHPPGKVPDLPTGDQFDLDTDLDQLQTETEWLQDELQDFQESASDVSNTEKPALLDGQNPELPRGFLDNQSQRIEQLWQNRQQLQIDHINVQPVIDTSTAITKVVKPGQPGASIPSSKLLQLHSRLTAAMQSIPASTEIQDKPKEKNEATSLSLEQIKWMSRLQSAQSLVHRAVELRMRFEANRFRALNQKSPDKVVD